MAFDTPKYTCKEYDQEAVSSEFRMTKKGYQSSTENHSLYILCTDPDFLLKKAVCVMKRTLTEVQARVEATVMTIRVQP
jgi:hypothetical protein